MPRRPALRLPRLPLAFAVLLALPLPLAAQPTSAADDPALVHARELLARVPLVDGHNDLPWTIREEAGSDLDAFDLRARRTTGDTDLPRLAEGMVAGQFWSVWIPSGLERPARTQLEQIELARRMIAA